MKTTFAIFALLVVSWMLIGFWRGLGKKGDVVNALLSIDDLDPVINTVVVLAVIIMYLIFS